MSEQLAEQFVETYYLTMQKNKDDMIAFYTEDSIFTYEGNHNKGLKDIKDRLEQFSFKTIKHEIVSMDVHPSPIPAGLLILITGKMQMDEDPAYKFCQSFHLLPNNSGGYFCANDIFRLVMHDSALPGVNQ